ncbi:hypothetical protein BDR26DRAFT_883093 [Obelidium mucronatum]|nr:hypothetical protein BDR26DRAFT_883093 [Obelidium mucronatum]
MSENSTSIVVQVVGESLSNSTSALIPAAAAAADPQVSSTVSSNVQATTSISSDSAFISIIWPTNHSSTTSATITTTSKTPTVTSKAKKTRTKASPSPTSLIKSISTSLFSAHQYHHLKSSHPQVPQLHLQYLWITLSTHRPRESPLPSESHVALFSFFSWLDSWLVYSNRRKRLQNASIGSGGSTGGNGRYNARRTYGNMTGSTRFLGPSAYSTASSPQKLLGTNSRSFASSAGETAVHTTLDPESRHGTLARPKKVVTFYESPVRSVASSSEDSFPPSYASKTIATAPPAVIVAVNDDKEKDPVVMHQKAGDFFPAEKQKHIRSSTGGSEVSCEFETWDSEVVGKYYETSLYSESDYSSGK